MNIHVTHEFKNELYLTISRHKYSKNCQSMPKSHNQGR